MGLARRRGPICQFAPSMRLILESSQAFYVAAQKQRAAEALMQAAMSLGKV
jgi:adenylate cyclase